MFFDTRMRIAPAADRLFIHRNTLVIRLEKAERLMGHRLIERTTATQAALEVRASEAFIAARALADS
ncbi:helix-turn-helix domain-containing protein [Microbacteriaceae bacterium K1510]|nr:helix-turn-helix domain-containing protein [Microbacteriaceae bacterium K1510]